MKSYYTSVDINLSKDTITNHFDDPRLMKILCNNFNALIELEGRLKQTQPSVKIRLHRRSTRYSIDLLRLKQFDLGLLEYQRYSSAGHPAYLQRHCDRWANSWQRMLAYLSSPSVTMARDAGRWGWLLAHLCINFDGTRCGACRFPNSSTTLLARPPIHMLGHDRPHLHSTRLLVVETALNEHWPMSGLCY